MQSCKIYCKSEKLKKNNRIESLYESRGQFKKCQHFSFFIAAPVNRVACIEKEKTNAHTHSQSARQKRNYCFIPT